MTDEIAGRCLVGGTASGRVLFTDVPLSFWMGVDPTSGEIIDRHHPFRGEVVTGRVVVMPSGRGSCAGSCGILELIMNGMGPAALVFEHPDPILTLGAIVADEMFGTTIPVVTVGPERFAALRTCDDATVTSIPGALAGGELQLTRADRMMLAGAEGAAGQIAMRIIVRLAATQGATELIDVEQAHIDGCFYTGPAGLRFAETLADRGGRVKVPSTTNASSVDATRWRALGIDPAVGEAATRVGAAYVRMGVRPTFTCAPYLLDSAPLAGQQIAWGESNAVAYANSVLGARTMKYPDFADICVALTGRARRRTRTSMSAVWQPPTSTSKPSVVSTTRSTRCSATRWARSRVTGFRSSPASKRHIRQPTTSRRSVPHLRPCRRADVPHRRRHARGTDVGPGIAPRATADHRRDSRAGLLETWRELDSVDDVSIDLVSLGNPHFSLTEIAATVDLCRGRSKDPRVAMIITCGRDVHAAAHRAGHITALEAFGAQVLNDTCWCMIDEPVLPVDARTVITNSAKYAHYGPGTTGRHFRFASLATCVDAACTGLAPNRTPAWLEPD